MAGRTVLITGSTDGLGRELAVRLAVEGARVLVHGRDAGRAEEVRDRIREATAGAGFGSGADSGPGSGSGPRSGSGSGPRSGSRSGAGAGCGSAEVLLADLADLRAVDRLADEILARHDRLDVLINNAGLGGGPPGSARQESADGYELRFAVNYLAGYRLTRRLLPLLTRSAPARVVNVASVGQQALDFTDVMLERGYDRSRAYAQSKLAQIMFTFDLADELDPAAVFVGALHPATYMATTMVREAGVAPWSTVEEGVEAVLHLLAASARGVPSGRYFNGTEESRADAQAYDAQARRRLRELSGDLVARALAPGRA
ncbi:SDR family NAD(P)-dependent oxidoreductase [Streptomyces milbemycinicus]|uniref:SDR family NAD(P)-dependent oxidoreductase n=1 Tax=Streptomyces milbemycinicus TaxID=476552 RepID=UPI001FE24E83|nr:SDR family NAD(P)-dependent oxidoreductase [Streptomyces milbemycinicus]